MNKPPLPTCPAACTPANRQRSSGSPAPKPLNSTAALTTRNSRVARRGRAPQQRTRKQKQEGIERMHSALNKTPAEAPASHGTARLAAKCRHAVGQKKRRRRVQFMSHATRQNRRQRRNARVASAVLTPCPHAQAEGRSAPEARSRQREKSHKMPAAYVPAARVHICKPTCPALSFSAPRQCRSAANAVAIFRRQQKSFTRGSNSLWYRVQQRSVLQLSPDGSQPKD